jgi:hypothetical protein
MDPEDFREDEIPDYTLAASVLNPAKDYKTPEGYPRNGHGNVFAIDCEMIYVYKRVGAIDDRKNPEINLKLIKPVSTTNSKGYRGDFSKNPDNAHSFIELMGATEIQRLFPTYFFHAKTGKPITFDQINQSRDLPGLARAIETYYRTPPNDIVHAVAQVTITDINGIVIYNKYIPHDQDKIYWTSAYYSGISKTDYCPQSQCVTLAEAQAKIFELAAIPDAIFVGHALINSDFPAMEIKVGTGAGKIPIKQIRDTSIYYGKMGEHLFERSKLNTTVQEYLKIQIQKSGAHDPSEDARGSLALYLLNRPRYDRLYNKNTPDQSGVHDPKYDIVKLIKMLLKFNTKSEIVKKIIVYARIFL